MECYGSTTSTEPKHSPSPSSASRTCEKSSKTKSTKPVDHWTLSPHGNRGSIVGGNRTAAYLTASSPSSRARSWRSFSRISAITSPTPVSYTHLRAHETGRNLVCRLLLEKKKKTQN